MTWAEFIAEILVRSGFAQGQTCPGYDWAADLLGVITLEQGFQQIANNGDFQPRWAHWLCVNMPDLMTAQQIDICYNRMREPLYGLFMAKVDVDVDYREQGFEGLETAILRERDNWRDHHPNLWAAVRQKYGL